MRVSEVFELRFPQTSFVSCDTDAAEIGNPRYILDLLLSIINVSVQTVDIVNSLPKLEFENGGY